MIKIKIRDYSEYDSAQGNNGGAYAWGDTLYINGTKIVREPWTSAEFCPYCRSWDCSGTCSNPERITAEEAADLVRLAQEHGDEITIERW